MQRRPLYVVAKVILVLCFAVHGGIVPNSTSSAAISPFLPRQHWVLQVQN